VSRARKTSRADAKPARDVFSSVAANWPELRETMAELRDCDARLAELKALLGRAVSSGDLAAAASASPEIARLVPEFLKLASEPRTRRKPI
jgi:hypothetical protein